MAVIPGKAVGLLLYGSRARADFAHNSNLDLPSLVRGCGEIPQHPLIGDLLWLDRCERVGDPVVVRAPTGRPTTFR